MKTALNWSEKWCNFNSAFKRVIGRKYMHKYPIILPHEFHETPCRPSNYLRAKDFTVMVTVTKSVAYWFGEGPVFRFRCFLLPQLRRSIYLVAHKDASRRTLLGICFLQVPFLWKSRFSIHLLCSAWFLTTLILTFCRQEDGGRGYCDSSVSHSYAQGKVLSLAFCVTIAYNELLNEVLFAELCAAKGAATLAVLMLYLFRGDECAKTRALTCPCMLLSVNYDRDHK